MAVKHKDKHTKWCTHDTVACIENTRDTPIDNYLVILITFAHANCLCEGWALNHAEWQFRFVAYYRITFSGTVAHNYVYTKYSTKNIHFESWDPTYFPSDSTFQYLSRECLFLKIGWRDQKIDKYTHWVLFPLKSANLCV